MTSRVIACIHGGAHDGRTNRRSPLDRLTQGAAMTDTATLDLDTMTATIDAHLAAYCEPDATARAAQVAAIWAADGELTDPPIDGRGHEGIAALGDIVQAHYAGQRFQRTSAVDSHHGVARYAWALVAPDGSTTITGLDVAEFDAQGKLARVVGFFGELAPVA
jgi:hypothetical protein